MIEAAALPLLANRYQLGEKLGSGGMGSVYRAQDRLSGQVIALKRVLQDLGGMSDTEQADLRLGLAREFRTLASLHHPHIITVLDYGFDHERQPYFTMDLLDSARKITEAGQNISLHEKIRLIIEMLQALAYLHRRGVLHRDLKPANVLVDHQGRVRVLDFGLASDKQERQQSGGTMAYMAPEILQGEQGSPPADLFAVGMIAYEILVGKYPFETDNYADLVESLLTENVDLSPLVELPGYMRPGNPRRLIAVMEKLLAKQPAQRYQNAESVIAALCEATGYPMPAEGTAIRESFLQAAAFVGRETELTKLKEQLDLAMTGQGSAWLVGGESGVGKSRLLDELRVQALIRGAVVLRGQGEAGGGRAYQLWRDMLRRLALTTPLTDMEASILKELVPDLAQLLERDIPDAPRLEGQVAQQRLILTLADIFKRQTQPLVLLLEDLQWAVESLEPLKHLLQFASQSSWLILGSYRDDEAPDLPAKLRGMQHLKLERLSPDAITHLSAAMLGERGRQPELVSLLRQETEGNVFFLVEVVRALAEEAGSLDAVAVTSQRRNIITSGVLALMRKRLACVPIEAQSALKLAAVAGRELDLKVLAQTGAVPSLDQWLVSCANAAVLEVMEGQWRFTHDKLRETLIADLSADERPGLHHQIAMAIEDCYGQQIDYAEILAAHWEQAQVRDKAIFYILMAAERLINLTAQYNRAEMLLHQGMNLLDDQRGVVKATLYRWLGDAAEKRGSFAEAIQCYTACLEQTDSDPITRIRSQIGLSRAKWRQSAYAEANQHAQASLQAARSMDDQWGVAASLSNLGVVARAQGDYTAARQYHEESLSIRRSIGDQQGIGMSLSNLGVLTGSQGDYAAARIFYDESLRIQQAIGDRWGIAVSLNNLGVIAISLNDPVAAQQHHEASLAVKREIGDRNGIATSLNNLGVVAVVLGDYAAARGYQSESLTIKRDIGEQNGIAISLTNLSVIELIEQNYHAAQAYLEESLHITRTINSLEWRLHSLGNLVITYSRMDRIADAKTLLIEGLKLAQESQSLSRQGHLILSAAFLAHAEQRPQAAAAWIGLVASKDELLGEYSPLLMQLRGWLVTDLGAEAVSAAMEQGQTLTVSQIVADLLAGK